MLSTWRGGGQAGRAGARAPLADASASPCALTAAEAAAAALPVVVTSYLPGQEAGNVHFVVENGFGTLRKKPAAIADVVSRWLQSPAQLRKLAKLRRHRPCQLIAGQLQLLQLRELASQLGHLARQRGNAVRAQV